MHSDLHLCYLASQHSVLRHTPTAAADAACYVQLFSCSHAQFTCLRACMCVHWPAYPPLRALACPSRARAEAQPHPSAATPKHSSNISFHPTLSSQTLMAGIAAALPEAAATFGPPVPVAPLIPNCAAGEFQDKAAGLPPQLQQHLLTPSFSQCIYISIVGSNSCARWHEFLSRFEPGLKGR